MITMMSSEAMMKMIYHSLITMDFRNKKIQMMKWNRAKPYKWTLKKQKDSSCLIAKSKILSSLINKFLLKKG